MLDRSASRAIIAACIALTGCRGCASCEREDEDGEEQEERDRARDHFWRAEIVIVGSGRVKTFIDAFDCVSDGGAAGAGGATGQCGPRLVTFKELHPATMQATPAPGWVFDHWEARIRERDGAIGPRPGRMPDGPVYLDGFGYSDTGQLETVTAVFVPAGG